jgi:hypothetical protein
MPWIGELPSKGLKFCVMLVSGEDSITRAGALELLEDPVELEPAAGELVAVDGVDELDEQAARPAARRPVAPSASALLLVILLVVNFDLSFRG